MTDEQRQAMESAAFPVDPRPAKVTWALGDEWLTFFHDRQPVLSLRRDVYAVLADDLRAALDIYAKAVAQAAGAATAKPPEPAP